jgi:hypothetical protein
LKGTVSDATEYLARDLLLLYGTKKKGTPRPHFSENDRRVLEKELCINLYSKEQLHCDWYGKA